jgi:hypothetical protein
MKELIEQIKLKADSIPTNTKENRRAKGAYVDCLMMAKEANKNLVLADVSGQLKAFAEYFNKEFADFVTIDGYHIEEYIKSL